MLMELINIKIKGLIITARTANVLLYSIALALSQSILFQAFKMANCKKLKIFFHPLAEKYLHRFVALTEKILFKLITSCHFKRLKLKPRGYEFHTCSRSSQLLNAWLCNVGG
jgi:hypothetical protein